MDEATRKKGESWAPRASSVRPVERNANAVRSTYASVLARARTAGIVALTVVAPLGVLAGTISACGAAPPARPTPYNTMVPASAASSAQVAPPTGAGTEPAPIQPIPAPQAKE